MTKILSGKVVRDQIAENLKSKIKEALRARGPLGRRPKLVIIQVGDVPESKLILWLM